MKIIFLLIIFIYILIIASENNNNFLNDDNTNDAYFSNNQTDNDHNNDNYDDNKIFLFHEILSTILKEVINKKENKNEKDYYYCLKIISQKYNSSNNSEIIKLYEGSSKGFKDLSSFYNCIEFDENGSSKYNYYTVYPLLNHAQKLNMSKLNHDSIYDNSWIFGFCLVNNDCTNDALKKILVEVNKIFNQYNVTVFNDYYNDIKNFEIINNIKTYEKYNHFSLKNFFNSISIYFIIIQILFTIFKVIPEKIFGCCIKRKYRSESQNDSKKIDYLLNNIKFSKKINSKIRECFSFLDNFDDFYNNKKDNEIFKDEDLTYIKGIKAIGIIFLIFGTTFIYFFNYPLIISESSAKKEYLKSFGCLVLIIFWRISPALLLSSSGYSLSYKFLNFLDKKLANLAPDNIDINSNSKEEKTSEEETSTFLEKTEKSNDKIDGKSSSKFNSYENKPLKFFSTTDENKDTSNSKSYEENTLGIKFYQNDLAKKTLNNMFRNQRVNDTLILSKISTNKIPYSIFFNFIFRQFHKIFCMNIGINYYKNVLPLSLLIGNKGAPLINYFFNEYLEKIGLGFGNYLFYQNFKEMINNFHEHENENKIAENHISFLKVFSLIVCENNFFIIGSILIFICYKKRLPLDYIIVFLLILFAIIKIIYNCRNDDSNPGMIYFDCIYHKFFLNPIFNFNYYLIGILYGIVNYVVQNDISKNESFIKERPMVAIPIFISRACDYKKRRNMVHFIFSLIFLIIFLSIFTFFLRIFFTDIIENNDASTIFKIISSIDVDFFLYLFHFFMIACYISGRNMFFKFLNSNVWVQISKLYIWIIIFTSLTCYYIIYNSETQLNLSVFIVLIYGAICGTNLYLLSIIFFILFELPYKKLIKLYFNISSKINETDEEEEDIEDENNNNSYPLQKDSVLDELSEKELQQKNNEEKDEEDEEK